MTDEKTEVAANPVDSELAEFAKDADIKLEEPAKPEAEEKKEEKSAEDKELETPKEETPKEEKKEKQEDESQVPDSEIDEADEDTTKDKKARIPKVIPAWKHKVAEKQWEKKEESLKQEIETLKNKPSETPAQKENIDEKVKVLAEESGLDESILRKIVALNPTQQIPQELANKIDKVVEENKELKERVLNQQDETTFNNDFTSDVIPLIKGEYGDISDSDLVKIKNRLDKISHMKEYASTPLDILYKGLDTFRPIKGKKSAEGSEGGKARGDSVLDLKDVSLDQIEKWKNSNDPKDMEKLEKYFTYQDSLHSND